MVFDYFKIIYTNSARSCSKMNLLLSKQMKKTKGRKQFGFYDTLIPLKVYWKTFTNHTVCQQLNTTGLWVPHAFACMFTFALWIKTTVSTFSKWTEQNVTVYIRVLERLFENLYALILVSVSQHQLFRCEKNEKRGQQWMLNWKIINWDIM